ncbi:unnamed protein product [Rotaria sp. Silwood2]|nr:unnamed protein product [Rotaria sp. Silwood2]
MSNRYIYTFCVSRSTSRTLIWKLDHDHFFYDITKTSQQIQQAFDDWASYTKLTFRQATAQEKADFHLVFAYGNHSDEYPFDGRDGVLAHAFPLEHHHRGYVHFDSSEIWSDNSNIADNARWIQKAVTVAGGHGEGNATNQLNHPRGLFVDDDQTIIIADTDNHRIIQWKINKTNGQVVAGGNGQGNRLDQLDRPTDVLIDKETYSLIICDRGNRRIVRWSRHSGATQREILIDNVACRTLAMDDQKCLYISDADKNEVRRYQIGDKNGTIVAGGYGKDDGLNQLNDPYFIFVDHQQVVYVSDKDNHAVMQGKNGAKEGIVVAGGQGYGSALAQLSYPYGLFVDTLATIYVSDSLNNRVVRWPKGAKQGTVIVGGNGYGEGANQFKGPVGLSFDRHGNLYVVDHWNNRVQRFSIE